MNILDAVIIVLIIVGALSGLRRGLVKEVVLLIGLVATIVVAFYLRVPVSAFFYKNLPFFGFSGLFKGVSILNILLYEVIAFLLVFSILYLVLRILLKITNIIETILKATIILGFFSKIGGAIIGAIESYLIIFIILFIFNQPFINIEGMEDSKFAGTILESTPIMSKAVKNTNEVVAEVYELSQKYDDDKEKFNSEAINLFLKYDIITESNLEILRKKGKIN